jgi:hypothetical protein
MAKSILALFLFAIFSGSAALAQEVGRVEAEETTVSRGVFESPFLLSPSVGALGFESGQQQYTSRITEGVRLAFNSGRGLGPTKVGLETGFLYSHLGASNSGFFGSSDSGASGAGSNMFLFPLNLMFGMSVTDNATVAAFAGTAAIYRSDAGSMTLGRTDVGGTSSTDFFPSVGLSGNWGVTRNVALTLRGDYIPTPASDLFTATVGATIGIG